MRVDYAEIDDEEVKQRIRDGHKPEQVFDEYQLREWAEENGYVKSEQD